MRNILYVFSLFVMIQFSQSQPIKPVQIAFPGKMIAVKAGEQFTAAMQVTIEQPWHINSDQPHDESLIPTKVSAKGSGAVLKGVEYPQAHDVEFGFSDQPVSVFEGVITVGLVFSIEKSAPAGELAIDIRFNYQACDNQSCLPPSSAVTTLRVLVEADARASEKISERAVVSTTTTGSDSLDSSTEPSTGLETYAGAGEGDSVSEGDVLSSTFEKSGLAVSLFFIFIGGLALNLTPCVYPLIPITIGYFGGQSEGKTSRLFLLGVLYMLGMAMTYSVIGVVTSLSGALFGTLLQNMYVIIGIAALFVVLALSQFGVYEFNLPSSWMAAAGGSKGGSFGAFFMGLTMGIVAAPCIGPFVLGLVTFVAAKGDPFQGFLMFFVLALGLGFPYLLLALFSGKIKNLPRSGEWMEGVKHLFGFIMLGMAIYFLLPILPKNIQPFLLPLFGILSAVILLFVDKRGNSVKGFRMVKVVLSLLVISLSVYALIPAEKNSPAWEPFTTSAYEEALQKNEMMIVDFSADWCIPCKELDALTFSDSRVIEQSQRFRALKADLTQSDTPESAALTNRFNIKGVPTVLIINARGEEVERITGYINADLFLEKMQRSSHIFRQ